MSNNKERKIPDYLKFPFERYLMVRVEFLILTQNELEAKIMRIIEWAIECKRDELSRKGLEVPDEVWVTIPENIFMDWLYGTVQSETTLKAAIKSIIKKYLVFKRPSGTGRYDALEYTLNKPLISKLFTLFPEKINDVDMASIMKQPRKSKDESEGQKLTPSKIDPLIRSIREAIFDPLNKQLLTPSSSIIDPLTELRRGSIIDPKKEREETKKESKKESALSSLSSTPLLSSLSDEDLLAEINRRQRQQGTSSVSSQETKPIIEQSTTVDNSVDKTTNNDASLIANGTTSNRQAEAAPSQVESMTTRNASNEANTGINNDLDPEQQRIAGYLEEIEFDFDLTPLNKQHLTKLAKRVKSGEQMKSLKAFTENQELLKGKTIYLGNLANANNLNGWRQSEQAKQRAEAQKSAPINPSKLTSVSGMRNYSAEPEIQPTIQKPPQDGLVQIPKFSLKGLRQQMKKEGKLV